MADDAKQEPTVFEGSVVIAGNLSVGGSLVVGGDVECRELVAGQVSSRGLVHRGASRATVGPGKLHPSAFGDGPEGGDVPR